MPLILTSVSHDANIVIHGTIPFFGQDNQKQMLQHHFFGHVMPLTQVPASCDANDIINGITVFA